LLRQITLYAIVGVIGTLIDVGLFWALVSIGTWPALAVTVAYFLATAAQFYLNRQYSFASFDRAVLHQMGLYAVITVVTWLLTLGIVQAGISIVHLAPLVAKVISIPPVALLGFLANRYLTFAAAHEPSR
jgi:putative flippase GtrA